MGPGPLWYYRTSTARTQGGLPMHLAPREHFLLATINWCRLICRERVRRFEIVVLACHCDRRSPILDGHVATRARIDEQLDYFNAPAASSGRQGCESVTCFGDVHVGAGVYQQLTNVHVPMVCRGVE